MKLIDTYIVTSHDSGILEIEVNIVVEWTTSRFLDGTTTLHVERFAGEYDTIEVSIPFVDYVTYELVQTMKSYKHIFYFIPYSLIGKRNSSFNTK